MEILNKKRLVKKCTVKFTVISQSLGILRI